MLTSDDIEKQEKFLGRRLIDWNKYDWFVWAWHGIAGYYTIDYMIMAAKGMVAPFPDDPDRSKVRAFMESSGVDWENYDLSRHVSGR